MDTKQFLVSGKERRELKKQYNNLNYFINNFYYHHQLDKDMYQFLNCDTKDLMDDESGKKLYDESITKIKEIKDRLNMKNN